MATKTIDNVIYITAPDTSGCDGCVAQGNNTLCLELAFGTDSSGICTKEGSIWIKRADVQDRPAHQMKYKINDVTYKTIREVEDCEGCAAQNDIRLCTLLRQGSDEYCCEHGAIWIEQVNPEQAVTLQTSQGPLQPTAVEGRKPCNGCVAQLNARLCNEIGDQHNCVQNPGTIWIKAQPKPVPGIAEAIQLLAKESTLTEVLEYCKVNKLNFRI